MVSGHLVILHAIHLLLKIACLTNFLSEARRITMIIFMWPNGCFMPTGWISGRALSCEEILLG